jgi:hypothetical protein
MKPNANAVIENILFAIGNFKEYQNEIRKQQMFSAIHAATELMRTTCKLKYARIYTEARSDHYRVKIYQSNYPDLTTKKKHKLFAIVRIILQKFGFNVDIDTIYFDSENIIFRVYDRK